MTQEPVAWMSPDESSVALTKLHESWVPLFTMQSNAVLAEREACADECVKLALGGGFAADCAAAIRARGQA